MKKGNLALFGWLYFTISPSAAVMYEGIKSFAPKIVICFLLFFIIALLCCCWGAYRKYSYFYRPLPMPVDNQFVAFVMSYRLFVHRVFITLLSMHMLIFYFIDSPAWIFFTILFLLCFYSILNRLYKKRLQKELNKIIGVVLEMPQYHATDYFPIWACVLMGFAAFIETLITSAPMH